MDPHRATSSEASAARQDRKMASTAIDGTRASTSAKSIPQVESDACIRSTAADAILSKCSAVDKGYFDDPFVRFFAPKKGIRRAPLINRGYYARFKAIDTILDRFLSASNKEKKRQVVVLGAGVDTLYFRLSKDRKDGGDQRQDNHVTVFDLDFEQVCKKKIQIVRQNKTLAALAKESVPENRLEEETVRSASEVEFHGTTYHILPADLRDLSSVESQLSKAGIDFNVPTLFLSECVLIYMEHEFSNNVIRFAANKFSTSVFVTYEQIRPNTRFGSVMVDNIRRRGCPLLSIHEYPNCVSLKRRYETLGYSNVNVLDMNQVYYNYLDAKDVSRIQRLELFDELEEWHLIQGHYSIAVAINESIDDEKSQVDSPPSDGKSDLSKKKPSIAEFIAFVPKEEKVPSFFNKYVG